MNKNSGGKLKKLAFWTSMATSVIGVGAGLASLAKGKVAKAAGLIGYGVVSALLTKCLIGKDNKHHLKPMPVLQK